MGNLMMVIWFSCELKWDDSCRGHSDVKGYHGRDINMLRCQLLSGQSPPESPWGRLTWRLLLARASCYPARLPAIQLWMRLSRGHSTASSSTSSETAIISKEWAGWVISTIKLSYFLAILGLIGTYCVMCKGMFHCPAEGLLDTNNSQAEKCMPRLAHLKIVQWSVVDGISKKMATSVKDQLHSFIHMALSGQ